MIIGHIAVVVLGTVGQISVGERQLFCSVFLLSLDAVHLNAVAKWSVNSGSRDLGKTLCSHSASLLHPGV